MLNFYISLLDEVKKVLDKFYKRQEIQKLRADYGLDGKYDNVFNIYFNHIYHFICIFCLHIYLSMYHVHAVPMEDSIGNPGIGVRDGCEPPCGY